MTSYWAPLRMSVGIESCDELIRRGSPPLQRPISISYGTDDRSALLPHRATVFTAFGVLALVRAAVGLYSVLSFEIAQRRTEIGVRAALGADAGWLIRWWRPVECAS